MHRFEVLEGQRERLGVQVRPAALEVDLRLVVGAQGQGPGVVVDGPGEVALSGTTQPAVEVQLGGGRDLGQRGVARGDHFLVASHLEQGVDAQQVRPARSGAILRAASAAARAASKTARVWSSRRNSRPRRT